MFVPVQPLALWNCVASPDEQYLSQPTYQIEVGGTRLFTQWPACVARCQICTWLSDGDGSNKTSDIQCGRLARPTPDGSTYLCEYHFHACWTCRLCGVVLQAETDTWCSAQCEAADKAEPEHGAWWEEG
jgi:hypothetical protein